MAFAKTARRFLTPVVVAGAMLGAPMIVQAAPMTNMAPAAVTIPGQTGATQGTTIQLVQWRHDNRRRHHRRWRRPAPRRHHMRMSRRHVRWCKRHYRSYNPRTDRYRGYDHRYHRCRSPFRRR